MGNAYGLVLRKLPMLPLLNRYWYSEGGANISNKPAKYRIKLEMM